METEIAEVEKKLAAKEADAMAYAVALVITDNDTYTKADQFCVGLKGLENEIKSDFKDSKRITDAAHAAVCAQEKAHLDKVIPARNLAKQKMAAYQDEQERLRRLEEDRQRVIAQKAADDEALRQAEQAKAEGRHEEAEAIIQAPVYVPPVVIPRSVPKSATIVRKIWDFKIVNESLVPRQYLMVDDQKLRAQAKATGNSIPVPGVEFFQRSV